MKVRDISALSLFVEWLPLARSSEVFTSVNLLRWRKLTIHLSNGEVLTADHPDYLLMPPEKNWVLHVKPKGKGLQFVPTAHIASLELETDSVPS